MTAAFKAKAGLKGAVKRLAIAGGMVFASSKPCNRILTYHSVGQRNHEMNVTPDVFKAQMEWLAAHRDVISVADAAEGRVGVAIALDDGYRDNLKNAAPILSKLKLPATVFVVAGRLGGMLDHDHDPATSTLMTGDEVREIESMGFTVGSHTLTHRRLSELDEDQQRHEIEEGGRLLSETLGHAVDGFAYPYGSILDYDDLSMALAKASGHSYGLSNRYGVNRPGADRWDLRRIWVDRSDSLELFRAKVDGRLDGLAWVDSGLGIRTRRAVNRVLGMD